MGHQIGIQRESSLHASLKEWYSKSGDVLEASVDGYVIDILRGEQLVEIQTGNFSNIKRKISRLLETHPVHLVYPLATLHWVLRVDNITGEVISRRRSPKKGNVFDFFSEFVYIANLFQIPGLSFEIIFIEDEVIFINDGLGSWRRKRWSTHDRKLIKIFDHQLFSDLSDFRALIPDTVSTQFTARDLSTSCNIRLHLAQKMVYSLSKLGIVEKIGKQGRSLLYQYKQV